MTNTLTDRVPSMNLGMYRDNPFRRVFILPESITLPTTVTARVYSSANGALLGSSAQPTITLVGHDLTLEYAQPRNLPETAYHQILFDGRVVWAGTIQVSRDTLLTNASRGGESGTTLLVTEQNVSIDVPYTGDFLTHTFRNQAHDAATLSTDQAEASEQARLATEQLKGDVITLIQDTETAISDLQIGKADVAFTTSHQATLEAAQGTGNKLIVEVISGDVGLYVYASTASPTLQKLLTYTN